MHIPALKYDVNSTRNVVVQGRDYDVPHNVHRSGNAWRVKLDEVRTFNDNAYGGVSRALDAAASYRERNFVGKKSKARPVVARLVAVEAGDTVYLYAAITCPTNKIPNFTKYIGRDGYVTEAQIADAMHYVTEQRRNFMPQYLEATDRLPSPALQEQLDW